MPAPRRLTTEQSVGEGPPNDGGYRTLRPAAGRPHVRRRDLADPDVAGEVLLTVAHLSDLHLCDAQSPARAECLNRLVDLDSPVREAIVEMGTYRPHEFLTAQVTDAMVRSVNSVDRGPVGGAPLDLAISTGDNTDNAQRNELEWYLTLLDGGTVVPDSGAPDRYEGVTDAVVDDERYWHPDAPFDDLPRSRFGFPRVPGLLDTARSPFEAPGLALPWLAVHGNHDRLMQGTWPDGTGASTGTTKSIGHPALADDPLGLLRELAASDPAAPSWVVDSVLREVTADPRRRSTTLTEFIAAHFTPGARPPGHGFTAEHRAYYRYDHSPRVVLLVLDTVNPHAGWDGSLDPDQLVWLDAELTAADEQHRYAVLASHHPLSTIINDRTVDGASRRVLAGELDALLAGHPSVVLWLNGHTHITEVTQHASWWEVTAPSLIDWPQQGRIVELLRGDGTLTIAATMLDHAGELPWTGGIVGTTALAGLSRELAANDWQAGPGPVDENVHAGRPDDRNVLLGLPDPWADAPRK